MTMAKYRSGNSSGPAVASRLLMSPNAFAKATSKMRYFDDDDYEVVHDKTYVLDAQTFDLDVFDTVPSG